MDKELVVSLPGILAVTVQKSSSSTVLTLQYHSVLICDIISLIVLLVSYVKETHHYPPNVNMVIYGLRMDLQKKKEELKFVLMATGLVFVVGISSQLNCYANN